MEPEGKDTVKYRNLVRGGKEFPLHVVLVLILLTNQPPSYGRVRSLQEFVVQLLMNLRSHNVGNVTSYTKHKEYTGIYSTTLGLVI